MSEMHSTARLDSDCPDEVAAVLRFLMDIIVNVAEPMSDFCVKFSLLSAPEVLRLIFFVKNKRIMPKMRIASEQKGLQIIA